MKKPLILTTFALGAMLAGAAYAQQAVPGNPPETQQVQQRGDDDAGREERGPRWRRDFRGDARERFAERCSHRAERFSGRMVDRIERATRPTTDQKPLFDKLKEASNKAADLIKAACPAEPSFTPPGRLADAEKRASATLEAIRLVRPAMDAYYASLTDEQKARLSMSRRAMMDRGDRDGGWRERGERRQGWRDRDGEEDRRGRLDRFGDRDDDDGDDRGSRSRGYERTSEESERL